MGWIVSRSTWGAQMPIGELDVNVTPLERVIVASSGTKGCFTLPTCALQVSRDVYINTSILFEYVKEVSLGNVIRKFEQFRLARWDPDQEP